MIVYIIVNKINGKVYVGQTCKTLHHRWSNHVANARAGQNTFFCKAIRKYGKESFECYEMIHSSDPDNIDDLERLFITLFRTTDSNFGYNAALGGGFNRGWKHSKESRIRLSLSHIGNIPSDETRQKMSLSHTGKKRSEETRKRMRDAQKSRKPISNEARLKMRLAKLGIKRPPRIPEYCENIRKAKLGHPVSSETRRKISQTLKERNKHG